MSEPSEAGFRRAETHKLGLSIVSVIVFGLFAGAGAIAALVFELHGERLYGALGMSHHTTEDIAILRSLPGLTVIAPADPYEVREATRALAMRARSATGWIVPISLLTCMTATRSVFAMRSCGPTIPSALQAKTCTFAPQACAVSSTAACSIAETATW